MSFSVDTAALRSGAARIEGTRAAADGGLRRTLADPALGLPVDAAHQELTALAADAVELVVAALAASGAGTRRMADAYERTDGAVGDGLRGIRPA